MVAKGVEPREWEKSQVPSPESRASDEYRASRPPRVALALARQSDSRTPPGPRPLDIVQGRASALVAHSVVF